MRRVLSTIALLPLLLAGLVACSGDAKRDDAGQVQEQADVSATKVRKGDCISDAVEGDVTSLTAIPCAQPHGAEAYHAFDLPPGDYPGDEPIATTAEQGCVAAFTGFVGKTFEESVLEISQLTPSAEGWEADDRQILCLVTDPAGSTSGTLANANR